MRQCGDIIPACDPNERLAMTRFLALFALLSLAACDVPFVPLI